jgi:phenylacetate-CoA ligase
MAASASPVRKILVAGEPGGSIPEVRRRLERDWPGAEVLDHYGLTETGPVAFAVSGKTDRSGLRVLGDRYFAEVLVPGGVEPVREGEPGELVLTPLGRSDWPLIRYRTGDLVRARCDESGQLWLEEGILGRVDDMQVVRGVNVYPSAVDALVRSLEGVGEYRVVLSTRGALTEMRLEVEGEAAVAGELESLFEQRLCLRIPVRAVGAGTLPQFEMKARRWVREGIFPG